MYIQWIRLQRGNSAVHAAVSAWLPEGSLADFRPWKELLEVSTPRPLSFHEQQHLDSIADLWSLSSHPDSVKQALSDALCELYRIFALTNTNHNNTEHIATLSWFSLVPEEYVRMVGVGVPEAMLVLATYAVVLKKLEYMWWCQGAAEGLLTVVVKALRGDGADERWLKYLRWPIEEVLGSGSDRVTGDQISGR